MNKGGPIQDFQHHDKNKSPQRLGPMKLNEIGLERGETRIGVENGDLRSSPAPRGLIERQPNRGEEKCHPQPGPARRFFLARTPSAFRVELEKS